MTGIQSEQRTSGQHHTLLSEYVNDMRILSAFPYQIEAARHTREVLIGMYPMEDDTARVGDQF